jgi:ABC-2 type transport system permease protein
MSLRNVQTIWGKELRSYFGSPIAYVIAAIFLALSGLSFALSVTGRFPEATVRGFLFGPTGAFFLVILLAPILTMRLFAEEQKLGTMELLLTAPIRDIEIVLGKYLAALTILTGMFLLTIYFPLLLIWFGDPDVLPILTAYLALFFLGTASVAVGLLGSALTANQLVAAVFSMAVLLLLWLANVTASFGAPGAVWADIVQFLSLSEHVRDLSFGVIDTRDIIYFVSVSVFFLFLTVRAVETRRWR